MANERDRNGVEPGPESEPAAPEQGADVSRRGIIKGGAAAAIAVVGTAAFQQGCAKQRSGSDNGALTEEELAETAAGQEIPASNGTAAYYRALILMTQYGRNQNEAARGLLVEEVRSNAGSGEAHAALAYNYVQDWRNGWDNVPDSLNQALAEAKQGVQLEPGNFYTHWALAFTHRYRAHTNAEEFALALRSYQDAKERLNTATPAERRDFQVDFAEYMVYLLMPEDAIRRIGGMANRLWYKWIQAFAHHQNGEAEKGLRLLEPHLPFRPEYNDMYLTLAANYQLAGRSADAKAAIETFKRNRPSVEPVWTTDLERERGCFVTGDDEDRWIKSLDGAGLPTTS